MQVSRQFVSDFALVAEHYGCPPDEVEIMKACARANMQDAEACFAELAREARAAAVLQPADTLTA